MQRVILPYQRYVLCRQAEEKKWTTNKYKLTTEAAISNIESTTEANRLTEPVTHHKRTLLSTKIVAMVVAARGQRNSNVRILVS